MKLYHFPLSGNAHKVRLLLSMLNLPHEAEVPSGGAHKSPEFLKLNPLGQVPVLVDGEVVIRDSQAILAYLGQRYGGDAWWPQDAARMAQVVAWLSTAANEVAHGPALLRMHHKFSRAIDVAATQARSQALLGVLEGVLSHQTWLVAGAQPTVADLAVYPYVALAPEAHLDLSSYPALRAWLTRIQALPGHVDMSGLWRP
ncbi:glutathione S-transferase [Inhella inkyongensis]|uniref:Glutathione S-transferase n=1 Tax=Inhella inkyongensis TaxID=392593 RepID=A0A840S780_9BURK|nr:glutathione S-transferase family protein [Inhella inkyongensis]MBB5206325.1 glutathione S-transferase [Inhella inkyongensis]